MHSDSHLLEAYLAALRRSVILIVLLSRQNNTDSRLEGKKVVVHWSTFKPEPYDTFIPRLPFPDEVTPTLAAFRQYCTPPRVVFVVQMDQLRSCSSACANVVGEKIQTDVNQCQSCDCLSYIHQSWPALAQSPYFFPQTHYPDRRIRPWNGHRNAI